MRNNIVLIDFENVQPDVLALLDQDHFRVIVFVGANQIKISFEIAQSIQALGSRAEYIKISGNGRDALDFHIAYYIGILSAGDPTAYFHIVSNDKGFDPLIQHLKGKKVFAGRVTEVAEIPAIKATTRKTPDERAAIVLDRFSQPKSTKPRTLKTLASSIASFFQKQLTEEEVSDVISALVKREFIKMDGTKVIYIVAGDA